MQLFTLDWGFLPYFPRFGLDTCRLCPAVFQFPFDQIIKPHIALKRCIGAEGEVREGADQHGKGKTAHFSHLLNSKMCTVDNQVPGFFTTSAL